MKKYLFIFKTQFLNNIQYLLDIILGFLTHAIVIYIYYNLYMFIYSDETSLINGYSFSQMVWYILFTESIWLCVRGRKIIKEISNDVKSGNIAYQLNKPYNYVNYMITKVTSDYLFKIFLSLPVSIIIGYLLIGNIPNFSIIGVLAAILCGIIGGIINMIICIIFGLLSFFMEDSNPVYWVYQKILLVIGTLFPIEFMPAVMQPILRYSFVFAINYGPAKLFVEYTPDLLLKVVLFQLLYGILFYIIAMLVYRKGVKNINVNGG